VSNIESVQKRVLLALLNLIYITKLWLLAQQMVTLASVWAVGMAKNPRPWISVDKIRHGYGADTLMDIHG